MEITKADLAARVRRLGERYKLAPLAPADAAALYLRKTGKRRRFTTPMPLTEVYALAIENGALKPKRVKLPRNKSLREFVLQLHANFLASTDP